MYAEYGAGTNRIWGSELFLAVPTVRLEKEEINCFFSEDDLSLLDVAFVLRNYVLITATLVSQQLGYASC